MIFSHAKPNKVVTIFAGRNWKEFQEHRGRSLWEKKKNKPELYIPFMTSTKNLVNVGTKYHKYLLFKDTTENKEFFIKVSYILTNNNLLTRN
jgi:hypothetical protein